MYLSTLIVKGIFLSMNLFHVQIGRDDKFLVCKALVYGKAARTMTDLCCVLKWNSLEEILWNKIFFFS